MNDAEDLRSVQHLIELGYEDPHDAAERRRALEQQREAARRAAGALFAEGRTAEAMSALTRLTEEHPDWLAPRLSIARTCFAMRRFDIALEHLDWFTFHGVETANIALLRATIEFARRRLDAALDQAAYARRLDGRIIGADALIGDVYYRRGKLDDAEDEYRQELSHSPKSAAALAGLAAVALRRGDDAGAVDFALQSLAQNFRSPHVHYRFGVALARLGRVDEAITALETAAKLRPDFAAPFRVLRSLAKDPARADDYRRQGRERLRGG